MNSLKNNSLTNTTTESATPLMNTTISPTPLVNITITSSTSSSTPTSLIMLLQSKFIWRFQPILIAVYICLFTIGCVSMGPSAMGDAGDELIYLVPGDKLVLGSGETVTVDSDGVLRGVPKYEIIAAGVKARDVMKQLAQYRYFERYSFVAYGPRNIEVAGAIPRTGKYAYPIGEDWSIMNLLMNIDAVTATAQNRQYLLIRRAWAFPKAHLFLRGEILPELDTMGGEDVIIQTGDVILFPGDKPPIYIFGAVQQAECFTFTPEFPATLEIAVERAGGLSEDTKTNFIQVYRVLNPEKPIIFSLAWPQEKKFTLQAWDIVFVP